MILRLHIPPALLFSIFLLSVSSVSADESSPFDCHITENGAKFDLTGLGERIVNQTRHMPPSTMVQSLRFNLCDDLKKLEGIADQDQCEAGTRACLTQVNTKPDETDRVVSVIPLMQTSSHPTVKTSLSTSPKSISIQFNGPDYPHPVDGTPTAQTLNVTLLCASEEMNDPEFKSYDGSQAQVEWRTKAGCPLQDDGTHEPEGDGGGKPEHEPPPESTGSGVGWFFLMLILAFAAYFGFGAYYNYSTYGARGTDLIPHRDFWKEVPYMLSDVISHLCSTVRPRRAATHGYIAV